jgi:hydroxyacylglutathione hydrolase
MWWACGQSKRTRARRSGFRARSGNSGRSTRTTHPVYLNLPPTEPVPPPDRFLAEGDTFCIGALEFETLALRGHAPDHLGFLLTSTRPMHLFCGDAIFAGSIGRTDIPYADLATLREHLHTRVMSLPDDTILHPGHGPDTTVGIERATNPYL